jgi:hypothetical protein
MGGAFYRSGCGTRIWGKGNSRTGWPPQHSRCGTGFSSAEPVGFEKRGRLSGGCASGTSVDVRQARMA